MRIKMSGDRAAKQEDKKEKEEQMMAIYKGYQQSDENPVAFISYYNQLVIQSQKSLEMYGLQDVYPVGIDGTRKREKNKIVLYQEGIEIATIDENSNIVFSQEYLEQMKAISPAIYLLLQELNGQHFELPELQQTDQKLPNISKEETTENFTLTKAQLENKMKEKEQEAPEQAPEIVEEKTENEEENIEQIARKSGLTKNDINSCSTIDPQEKITDAESFENIVNVTGKYTKIFVVASNDKSKDNSRFAFWGLTPDGQVEQIPGLEERQGVNTGKSIYAINRDGTEVKEQQTAALFTLPNQREGFSVTIGQYGIVETTYIRKSPEENKFIGSTINSTTQKPTTKEVKEFMNDHRTTDRELQKTIKKTEEQVDEHQSGKTKLRNIDDNPNNDQAIDIDEEVTMHDGTVTTLRQEAEKLDMSPDDYVKEFEETEGDCSADKIENISLKYLSEEYEEVEESLERDGRLTPEEEALRRRHLL